MAHIHLPDDIPVRYVERGGTILFALMALVGLGAFGFALTQDAQTAWASYVANWLFFSSVAIGAVMFAVATTVVKAKWNWSVRRVSVSFAAFLPVAFLLFLPMLLFLREGYFPWIETIAEGTDYIVSKKAAYLNIPFLVTRQFVGVGVLFGLAVYFAYLAVRPDLGIARDAPGAEDASRRSWRERLTGGWRGQEAEEVRSWKRMGSLGPALALIYATVWSFVVYDFSMTLEPHWFSTLYGGWFFMGAFWGGIAATALATVWLRGQDSALKGHMGLQQRHDLGKLAFAFTVFWMYLFWSQYIVIWYGKLPWEQAWILLRSSPPWGTLSLLTIILCFFIPFAGLIGRKPKLNPKTLGLFTSVILVGLWLERYILVAPSLYQEGDAVFPWYHPVIALGFLGLFLLCMRWAWATFPVLQVWQPPVPAEMTEAELPARESRAGVAGD
jgi:hypothetical protein